MVEEIIEALHHPPVHESLHKGPSKSPGEGEGNKGADGQTDGREKYPYDRSIEEPSQKSGNLTRYGCRDNLRDLQEDEGDETEGTKGVHEGTHPFFARKESFDLDELMDHPQVIQGPCQKKPEYHEKYEKLQPVFGSELPVLYDRLNSLSNLSSPAYRAMV